MKIPFKYYVHDDSNTSERVDWISEQTGVTFTDEMVEEMGSPFYEVTLNCEFDSVTGEVTILGVG